MFDDLFDVLLGDRVEADDAAVEGLVKLKVFLLRTPPCPQRRSRRGEASNVCKPCTFSQDSFALREARLLQELRKFPELDVWCCWQAMTAMRILRQFTSDCKSC